MSDMRPQGQPDEAMVDLLVKQVTEGLSPAEQRALDVMDSESRAPICGTWSVPRRRSLWPAARGEERLPAGSRGSDRGAGGGTFRPVKQGHGLKRSARAGCQRGRAPAPHRRAQPSGNYGWLAAAACLVLAIFGWNERAAAPAVVETPPPPVSGRKTAAYAEERAALLAKTDSLKIPLGASKDPAAAGVSGDVVWDPATQRGFLHFAGLAPNDPAMHQYQLWIFDAGRDKRYPVDGGVFDVPANASDVIIPIRAALMVRKPAAFAVTLEKPGGVVVSGREHVIALGVRQEG